jgi:hypothetical protein
MKILAKRQHLVSSTVANVVRVDDRRTAA